MTKKLSSSAEPEIPKTIATLADVEKARDFLKGQVTRTQLKPAPPGMYETLLNSPTVLSRGSLSSLSNSNFSSHSVNQSSSGPQSVASVGSARSKQSVGEPEIFFKMENEQLAGSFKIRGALNKLAQLSESEKRRGVVASSAGNHAQGVAFGAKKMGLSAHIVMPLTTPIIKLNSTKSYGAEVILCGEVYDDAFAHAKKLEQEKNYIFVHPYQDTAVIAGQGTIGLEILEDLPDVDTIIVPIGGGGLISGIATAIKAKKPNVKIIGVVSDQACGMRDLYLSVGAGGASSEFSEESVTIPSSAAPAKKISTIAEGIAIKKPSKYMLDTYIKKWVDDIIVVDDDDISRAIVYLLEKGKTVTEGSGAAGLAALMKIAARSKPAIMTGRPSYTRASEATASSSSSEVPPGSAFKEKFTFEQLGKKICVVLCGGNIDLNVMAKVIERGLRLQQRLARFTVVVDDLPGNLNRLTQLMADQRANILEVYHDRVSPELGLRETRIDLLVETSSQEHIDTLERELKGLGFRVLALATPSSAR
jgi:threonine dehydratase